MSLGAWVLVVAVVAALGLGGWRAISDGRFRGTHRVRGASDRSGARVLVTGAERPPRPAGDEAAGEAGDEAGGEAAGKAGHEVGHEAGHEAGVSVLAGTAYDAQRGERATLLQFSSAFCAPCRSTRRILADVASTVPGVSHVEVDAEEHLDLVRAAGVLRTPTTLVLDADGREVTRASGAPRPAQVLAALELSL